MKIAHIVPSLEPRHGGPSKSVPPLAAAQARLGHAVELLATGPAAASRQEAGLDTRVFRRGSPEAVCPSSGLRTHLNAGSYDALHVHGLWLRTVHYAHARAGALGAPLVVSPRGMLSPWAWGHRRGRKWLGAKLIHPGALAGADGWHATSAAEADDIRARGFTAPVCVAPNGITPPDAAVTERAAERWRKLCPAAFARPTALFYSRFHQKKRVLELIGLWLAHAPRDWLLLVAGIPEDYTVTELAACAAQRGGADRVAVFDGRDEPPPYAAASLFLLPSHSENFGMVVAEALAHGLPAVVTDTTPWTELNRRDLGWCVPWENYAKALRAALAETPEARGRRGIAAREWATAEFSWDKSARLLAEFYARLREGKT